MRNFKTPEERKAYLDGARDMMIAIQSMDPNDYCRILGWKNDTSILAILYESRKRQVEHHHQRIATLLECCYYDKTEARKFLDSRTDNAVLKLYRCKTSDETQIVMTIRNDDYIAIDELIKKDITIGDPERLEKYFLAINNTNSKEYKLYEDFYCTIRDALASLPREHRLDASMYTGTISEEQTVLNLLMIADEDNIKFREVMQIDAYRQCVSQLLEMYATNSLLAYLDDDLLDTYRNKNGEPLKGAVLEAGSENHWYVIPGEYASLPAKKRFVRYVLIPQAKEILDSITN